MHAARSNPRFTASLGPVLGPRFRRFSRRFRRPAPRGWLRAHRLPLGALLLTLAGAIGLDVWLATCGAVGCPSAATIRAFHAAEGGRVVDRNGELLGHLTSIRRYNVPLAAVPLRVRQAVLATEDRRFYDHNGLDWRSVVRALARNAGAFGVREGFSTITMQVARNTFVPRRYAGRSLRRKLMELRMARLLERTLSKDQLLELYLNVIYLGNGAYGVEAASRDLFAKSVGALTPAEGALLAALPKGPSSYTPRRDPARARRRRDLVLGLMEREGYLSPLAAAAAAQEPLRLAPPDLRTGRVEESFALDAVRIAVDSILPNGDQRGDITVFTTIDLAAQRAAERAVRRRTLAIGREQGRHGGDVQGAMVALDPRTGELRAVVGGRTLDRGGFNRAFSARRQPGSAFKPFVYAAALATGLTPATLVDDAPVSVDEGGRLWTPANYSDEYLGSVTVRRALAVSSNAAAVRVSRAVGEPHIVELAHRAGITSRLDPVPSLALGALEVTPLELVDAYAPFGNGGWRVRPRLVKRIEAAEGTVLWNSETERVPAIDPRDAYQITSMLRSVVDYGTGHAVRDAGVRGPVAGKTGTTNNGTDVWFVGYTPTVVAGFWFGYDAPRTLGANAAGGRLAAPAWADFYLNGWREPPRWDADGWSPPPGMVMRVIDSQTGELAGEWCPVTQREWFKPGTEPAEQCREHLSPLEGGPPEWIAGTGSVIGRTLRRIFKF
ncbi:MAG: PBP1A family penicillin-binding protein [Gemmatimonadaceae bacterium]